MAHFAKLNIENIVDAVVVVNNDVITIGGIESEDKGVKFLKSLYGEDTQWKQTSYNSNFRGNYAGIGYTYVEELDAFIPPIPFESWVLDEANFQWVAPVPYPDDGKPYAWDEASKQWELVVTAEVEA